MRRLSTDEAWGAGADLWDLMYGEEGPICRILTERRKQG